MCLVLIVKGGNSILKWVDEEGQSDQPSLASTWEVAPIFNCLYLGSEKLTVSVRQGNA